MLIFLGENVWGAILGPMQVLFVRNCSHITPFKDLKSAPPEVQLALSILPAAENMISPLGTYRAHMCHTSHPLCTIF